MTEIRDTIRLNPTSRAIALGLSTSVLFLHLFDRQIMAILAEPIKADLGLTDTHIGLLTGIGFSLFYSTLGIFIARLADFMDRAKIVAASVAIFSGMTAVTGLMGSFVTMLLARMGVAVGEAGAISPLHALLSDIFPEGERARAFSIMQLGGPLGVMVAFLGGGYLVSMFDWRMVFFVAGATGLILALLVWVFMPEPRRNRPPKSGTPHVPFWSSIVFLLKNRAFVFLISGVAFAGIGLYALIIWLPSFLIRSFDLPVAKVGLTLGVLLGVFGAVAVLVGGQVADWLRRRDEGAHAALPAWMMLVAVIPSYLVFQASTLAQAIGFLLIPVMVMSAWQAPAIAASQSVAPPHMRALASALLALVLNLVGLGFGPLIVGILSDHFAASSGDQSLRMALHVVPVAFAIAGLFWLAAARDLRRFGKAETAYVGKPSQEGVET